MRKIINNTEEVVSELMQGFTEAYRNVYVKHPAVNGILYRYKRRGKVALVIGGGSGHEPMFSGFVGKGLADAAACGNIFASPDPRTIYETARAAESGKGILFVYGCYSGDNLNFDMAEEFLNREGIKTAHVRVRDDIASAPAEHRENRRGIAGDVFVIKIAGAACDSGLGLDEVLRIADKADRNTYSIGVATSSAQLPGAEEPIFELEEGKIEYGMGLHGEKGALRTDWAAADELAERMYEQLQAEADFKKKEKVCVLVNGLGSTTIIELSIIYRKLAKLLKRDGVQVYDADLNSYCTSQEMGGFAISVLRLDDELQSYYDMPCHSPYYAKETLKEDEAESYSSLFAAPAMPPGNKAAVTESNVAAATEVMTEAGVDIGDKELSAYARKERYDVLDTEDCRQMLLYTAERILDAEAVLTRIDSAIGDGDHGIGMAGGMKQMKKALLPLRTENAWRVFALAGEAMLMSMGGASGVIFGSLFLAGSRDALPNETLHAADFADLFERSLQAIQQRGGAGEGDKTMVDALLPAVRAMKESMVSGMTAMFKSAEAAAKHGAVSTKGMTARFGRAKTLGERAIGYPDAGAVSTWLIFRSMADFITTGRTDVSEDLNGFLTREGS